MKQVELAKIYADKKALIVNPQPKERTSLKNHLAQLGTNTIDMCANAPESIELCEKQKYDLIVSEYDLGNDKNGQQLIEELRYYKLLSNTAIYILLTQNTTTEQVLHTLEYQPDEYLSKPATAEQIRQRLNHSVIKKHILFDIYDALDASDNERAIKCCKTRLTKNDDYTLDILKQLGELYLKTQQYKEAFSTYSHALKLKSPVWAKVGLIKTYMAQNAPLQAQALAEKLIDDHPLCVNGFELLAELLEQKHDYAQAQHMLMQAVKLTPNAYERQKKLAKLSHNLGDTHSAYHAYKAAIKHAKHSHHETFEDNLSFSSVCMQISQTADKQNSNELIQASKNAIAYAKKRYPNQLLIPLRAHLLNAQNQSFKGNNEIVKKEIHQAKCILPKLHRQTLLNADLNFCIECAQALISLGEYKAGERLLLALTKVYKDEKSARTIDKYLREPLTKEGLAFAVTLNQKGIALYDKQQWHQASTYFTQVIQELPNHVGLNLNLVQALIAKAKTKPLSQKEWQTIDTCLKKIMGMPLNQAHKTRLEYIFKQKNKMETALRA